jgi:hypothetical protein
MNATRWNGFLGLGLVAIFGLVGCGGDAAPVVARSPSQPGPAMEPAPDDSGYSDSKAEAPPPPPAPASAPSRGSAPSSDDSWRSKSARREAPQPEERPGLGTQWGETRTSRISMVSFERADTGSPFAASALFYNDEEGARAMASASGFRRTSSGMFTVANGLVSIGLRDEGRQLFPGFVAGGRNFAVGEAGHRYTVVIRNNTSFRLEVVLSVDGLDVLDGKAASFAKRGYIVDARAELEVDGFRQSMDAVAAFRFGSVRGSYAGQKSGGDTRNVGVIGVALFNEIGTVPVPWSPEEVQRRREANPFPGQFATPP